MWNIACRQIHEKTVSLIPVFMKMYETINIGKGTTFVTKSPFWEARNQKNQTDYRSSDF